MKRIMAVMLLCAFALTCAGAMGEAVDAETQQALASYQQALRNEIDVRFTSYYDGGDMDAVWQEMTLAELLEGEYGESFAFTNFALVDLDMDLQPEIVLEISETEYGYTFAFIVLKAENDGAVYAHEFVYRAMEDLKFDGTFGFSSGAMDCGFGRAWLHFARHGITNITWCESGDDMETVYYYVHGRPATAEEFDQAVDEETAKASVYWYPLNDAVLGALVYLPW